MESIMNGVSIKITLILLLSLSFLQCKAADEEKKIEKIKLASLSFIPVKWEKDTNLRKIESLAREAAAHGAKILITPEGAVEGYLIDLVLREKKKGNDLIEDFAKIAESVDGPAVTKIRQLARELNVDIILGILERDQDVLYNSVIWIDSKGEVLHTHRKTHMAQPYYKPEFYHPGKDVKAFDTAYGRFGMMICYERQIPEISTALSLDGARILFNPSYGSRGEWNDIMLRTRARDNNTPLVFTHPLQTLVIDRKGNVILNRNDEEGINYFELDIEKQDSNRFHQRRYEVFKDKLSIDIKSGEQSGK
jgi:predicted amidohydrolase